MSRGARPGGPETDSEDPASSWDLRSLRQPPPPFRRQLGAPRPHVQTAETAEDEEETGREPRQSQR